MTHSTDDGADPTQAMSDRGVLYATPSVEASDPDLALLQRWLRARLLNEPRAGGDASDDPATRVLWQLRADHVVAPLLLRARDALLLALPRSSSDPESTTTPSATLLADYDQALATFDEPNRALLILAIEFALPPARIAAELQRDAATIESQLARVVSELAAQLP